MWLALFFGSLQAEREREREREREGGGRERKDFYIESCQNDRLSSYGITRVAFMIRATATMSHICNSRMSNLLKVQKVER
jgi:hypothetical protein